MTARENILLSAYASGDAPYKVVGILKPTGTVLDRLVLTSVASVWRVHEPIRTKRRPRTPTPTAD